MGASRRNREEQFEEEFNKFIDELTNTEMPNYLIDLYGIPPTSLPVDDQEEDEEE